MTGSGRHYLLAALCALLAFGLLVVLAPDPAASGLATVAPDRIKVLEPGEGHQARSLAAANWSLDFADQFRFDAETARQRSAGIGDPRVSPAERQWHFELTERESRGSPLALFVANAAGDLELHVNGTRFADGSIKSSYFGPGIGGTMLVAPIDTRALYSEGNRIDVIQSNDADHVGIRSIFIGSPAKVAAARQHFLAWLERQRLGAAIGAATGLLAAFVLLLTGRRLAVAAALAVLAALQVLALTGAILPSMAPWLWPGLSVAAAATILLTLRRPGQMSGSLALGLSLPALLGGGAGIALTIGNWLPPWPFQALEFANEGARPLLLLGGPALIWREGSALLARLRDARLEIQDRDRVIAQQQAALEVELRNAAVLEERQRFARDMHDGIGGHLQSLLMRVRAERIGPEGIADELQSGLADLRLMVDSLDQLDTNLGQALANFRLRAMPQLEAAGVALDWQVDDAIAAVRLDPQATLSLYRILQELVTNCVRHSGASRLHIDIGLDQAGSLMSATLSDDGCGFDPDRVKVGKGLTNLRRRAAKLKGSLAVASQAGTGTRIALSVPVDRVIES